MGMKYVLLIAIIIIIYKSNIIIDGYLLPEQQHIIRQHFFEVVHATNRTSEQTQYTKYGRLKEDSVFVSIDEFASFEFPCGRRSFLGIKDIQHYRFEAVLLVPCSATIDDLTFVPTLSSNITHLYSECRQIAGNEYVSISLEVYNETTRKIPEVAFQNLTSSVDLSVYPDNLPIIKMTYWTKDCSITCPAHNNSTGTDTIVKNVRCNSVKQKKKNRRKVLVCDFESECSWYFQSPGMLHNDTAQIDENFMIVEDEESKLHGKRYALMEMPEHARPAAMIISPFYVQTSQKCSIQLDYRVLGMRGDARIIISTEHRPPDNAYLTAEEMTQLRTPVQHAILEVENSFYPSSAIPIGHFSLPTRIRIECHNNLNGTVAPSSSPGYTSTTCYVDNIVLIDCEEHVTMENACSSTSDAMFICTSLGMKKCIEWDAVCDGQVDCPNGEDEEDCDFSLIGSKCDFESEDSLCAGWDHQTMLVTTHTRISEEMFIRANYTSAIEDNPQAKIPHYDRTIGEKGRFLWMSRRGHEIFATKQTSTRFYSPIYPPTVRKGSSPRNSEDLCFLRFWYCHYTTYTLPILKWDIVTGIKKPNRTQLMWSFDEPQHMQESTFCEWRRASIKLRPQRTPFQLQFSITPFIGEDPVILAIDDISLSPSCFPRDNLLSSFYNLSSCGAIGPRPPTMEICEKFLTTPSTNTSSVSSIDRGIQIWVVPETSEYRIELCGAAGGWLPGLKDLNGGGCVYALVNISQHDSITFVIGQQGMSPCDKKIMARSPELQLLCLNGSLKDDSLDFLPGTGGGGASKFLLSRTMTLLVAGGGGGLWLGASDEDSEVPMGGRELKEVSNKYKKRQISQISFLAGYGGSENDFQLFDGDCVDCVQMSGDLTTGRAGICSRKRTWNVPGGFGGGGASCGPGGAGGGGHIGGSPGNRSHGRGGTSWADEQILADFQANANHGGGYALIHPCKLKCPTNATCHFVHPREFIVICRCNSNGQFVKEDGICLDEDKEKVSHLIEEHSTLHINILILITCASISTMSVLCMFFVRRRYNYTRRKRYSNEVPLKMRPPRLEQRGFYEETAAEIIVDNCTFEQLEELPTIERPNIVLRDLLGHGAFGEVYKADLLLNGAVHQVAVKTLPFSSSKQSQDEFLMEAQIMNKFRHENIITLYGINFDLMPRYIVLELMNGGDLKSFLRTSRPNKLSANPNNLMMCNLVKMALDVAKGCEFLEANKFIHRDIAARNCLLSTTEPNSVVKIADFGMARDIYRSDYYRKGGHAMLPVKWMPPEALLDGFFTTKTDVWSFGVLTWEIFSLGYMPYPGRNNMEVMELIANGGRLEPPIGVPHQVYQLMLQCWKTDEGARPSFSMIVPWLHRIYEDPTISDLPLPDRTISLPSTAIPTPIAETPRSEVTMSTALNTPCGDFTPDGLNDPFSRGLGVSFNVCQPYQSKTGNGFLLSQQQHFGSIAEDESNMLDNEQIAMLPEHTFPHQFPVVSHVSGAYEWCAQPSKRNPAHNGIIVLDALSSDPPPGEIPRPNRLFVHEYDPELHAPPPPPRRPTTLRTANQLIDEQREIVSRSQESSRENSNENSKS